MGTPLAVHAVIASISELGHRPDRVARGSRVRRKDVRISGSMATACGFPDAVDRSGESGRE